MLGMQKPKVSLNLLLKKYEENGLDTEGVKTFYPLKDALGRMRAACSFLENANIASIYTWGDLKSPPTAKAGGLMQESKMLQDYPFFDLIIQGRVRFFCLGAGKASYCQGSGEKYVEN
ncbi:hypothetical protein [Desulfonatronum parangueonense]